MTLPRNSTWSTTAWVRRMMLSNPTRSSNRQTISIGRQERYLLWRNALDSQLLRTSAPIDRSLDALRARPFQMDKESPLQTTKMRLWTHRGLASITRERGSLRMSLRLWSLFQSWIRIHLDWLGPTGAFLALCIRLRLISAARITLRLTTDGRRMLKLSNHPTW